MAIPDINALLRKVDANEKSEISVKTADIKFFRKFSGYKFIVSYLRN
jgi:hypothetical protein